MKRLYVTLSLLLIPALLFAQSNKSTQSKTVVLTHVTVIDATGARAMPDMTVVIDGNRISDLGKSREVKVPKGAQVIDAAGKFLIPGLWDMHVHTFDKNLFLPLYVANGVTGVRDMFGPLPLIRQWGKEIEEGVTIGPRFIAAGPIVDGPKPIWPGSIAVTSEADGRKAVATVKEGGSDFVKVYALLPRDAYFAIADEAKRLGIPFAGHVPYAVSAAEASDAGQKSIEHLTGILLACSSKEEEISKESEIRRQAGGNSSFSMVLEAAATFDQKKAAALFARFARNGTWMSPTLTVLRSLAYIGDPDFRNDARLKFITPYIRKGMWGDTAFGLNRRTPEDNDAAKKVFQRQLEVVGAMRRAGVDIIAGTDTPNPYVYPGFSLHDELALLVKAGLTPMEALQAATSNAAKYTGQLDKLGTVEKGKVADLVLLDANPLADISNTKKINAVFLGGRLINKAALEAMLAKVEAANTPK
jgi:imidazolonepropionase-like amidohydrolase